MSTDANTRERLRIVESYFRRVDDRDPTLIDLFTDDVEMFFPKFGVGYGKEDMVAFSKIMGDYLTCIEHDIDAFNYIISGNHVVVEGTERGVTRDGVEWPDRRISEGRFCNVFEFDGKLISRVFIYVDPDYTSADKERIDVFARSAM